MATRVSFALGTWQLLTLAAGLRDAAADGGPAFDDDVLVLYETGTASEALKAAMREVAARAWPWTRVVEAFDILSDVPRRTTGGDLRRRMRSLAARVAATGSAVESLWLCWLNRPAERLVLETFAEARVVLYEDGLTSYLPLAAADEPAGAVSALRRAAEARLPGLRFRRWKGFVDPRHAARIDAARMVLGDVWPLPTAFATVPLHAVRTGALREAVATCHAIAAVAGFVPPAPGLRPRVLVLGQALSRFGALPRAVEQAVYADVVEAILRRGHDVLWKEHPRAEAPFFAALAAAAAPGRVRELALPFALPVELVAGRLGLAGCVAGISVALWTLPRLHGVAGYTFADRLAPHLRERWALQNELVRRSALPLDDLPAASPSLDNVR